MAIEETSNEFSASKEASKQFIASLNVNSSEENHTPFDNNTPIDNNTPVENNTPMRESEIEEDAKSVVVTQSVYGTSVKTKYFVSNYYVEKIVDNMKLD